MEKIYVEGNNQQQQKQNSNKRLFQVLVVLSFLVAAFAIVSIIAVGFNQVSYAADDEVAETESFSFTESGIHMVADITSYGAATDEAFSVPIYKINNEVVLDYFCINHHKEFPISNNLTYTSVANDSTDEGLKYIFGVAPMFKDYATRSGTDEYIQYYATQIAIWLYYGTNDSFVNFDFDHYDEFNMDTMSGYVSFGVDDNNSLGNREATETNTAETNLDTLLRANYIGMIAGNESVYLQNDEVKALHRMIVNEVQVAKKTTHYSASLGGISLDGSDDFSLSDDGSFYQSSLFSVIPSDSDKFEGYELSITGDLVDDVIIVDENGEECDNKFGPSDKFYLRIPSNKVNTEVQTIGVNVVGDFRDVNLDYVKYSTTGDYQDVIKIKWGPGSVDASKTLEIVAAEDTGISRTQTVYFIGLIVLLCGIGIIYANAKPIKNS